MGYTTNFIGSFDIVDENGVLKYLQVNQLNYLKLFSETRRMKRDEEKTAKRPDPTRESVNLPVGKEGEYFTGESGFCGQDRASDIIDYNNPPSKQPGLWCQWVPHEDGHSIVWNKTEKFYYYVEWLQYLIDNFLKPWGYRLKGEVRWQGESDDDIGIIAIDTDGCTVITKQFNEPSSNQTEEVFHLPNTHVVTHDPIEAAEAWSAVAFQLRDALDRILPVPEKLLQQKPVVCLEEILLEARKALEACPENVYS
jgi:hypothetical protein